MNSQDKQNSSDYLTQLWRNGQRCAALPPELSPTSRADAYAIQAIFERQSAAPLVAWKIAATSLAGQKHIGVSGPLAGRYIAEQIVPSGGSIPFGNNHMKVAEIEFAFRVARDLVPRAAKYSEDDILPAIASLHPSIEIPDSRYDHFESVGEAALIADNACAHWLCLGEALPETWRNMDLASLQPMGRIAGKTEVLGKGSNVLGSPLIALAWLVNELSSLGITLRQGQFVSTGTCIVPMPIQPGDQVQGEFPGLGSIAVSLI